MGFRVQRELPRHGSGFEGDHVKVFPPKGTTGVSVCKYVFDSPLSIDFVLFTFLVHLCFDSFATLTSARPVVSLVEPAFKTVFRPLRKVKDHNNNAGGGKYNWQC